MSPQDAMMHLKNMHNGANAGGVADPYKADGSPFPKGKDHHPQKFVFDDLQFDSQSGKLNCSQRSREKNDVVHDVQTSFNARFFRFFDRE